MSRASLQEDFQLSVAVVPCRGFPRSAPYLWRGAGYCENASLVIGFRSECRSLCTLDGDLVRRNVKNVPSRIIFHAERARPTDFAVVCYRAVTSSGFLRSHLAALQVSIKQATRIHSTGPAARSMKSGRSGKLFNLSDRCQSTRRIHAQRGVQKKSY